MSMKIKKRPFYGSTSTEPAAYEAPHREVARRAAAEGIVLLRNDGGVLPLPKGSKVALYGAGATHMIKGGTGSGDVNEREVVSILQGLSEAGYEITTLDWIAEYDRIYSEARSAWKEDILHKMADQDDKNGFAFFFVYTANPFRMPDGPAITGTDADTAIYIISRVAGEGADRQAAKGDYYLTDHEKEDIGQVCALYRKVILVVNTGGLMDLSFTEGYGNIAAIVQLVQPGMEGGHAFADVISGRVSPGGRLTDTWAFRYEDYPNASTFSHMNGNVEKERYEEGLYVGYRYFDSFEVPAMYGFGYGLSYTDFALDVRGVSVSEGRVNVEVKVTNTGLSHSGREVVQVYVTAPVGEVEKEYRKLCGFAKTGVLTPGAEETVTVTFPVGNMASYETSSAQWILESGIYGLWIGSSLEASMPKALLFLSEKKVLVKTRNICPLREELKELSVPVEKRLSRYQKMLDAARECRALQAVMDISGLETEIIEDTASEPEDEASRIAKELSAEQLIRMATGEPSMGQGSSLGAAGVSVPGAAGETSVAALDQGVANIVLADGPAGLRLNRIYSVDDGRIQLPPFEAAMENGFFCEDFAYQGTKYYQYCTAIPVGTLLAQSWDEKLVEEVGAMVAGEMERFGVTLWLAPGMNIHRNPLCGRNFEYYSEDPLVSGKMAAAMTRGVQSVPGCGTTIKHFACNNQEDNRMGSDSILSERVLREIYLKGFEIAVKESKPMSIMTSYNLINGVHAANCYDTCTYAARREWGFDGVIMTDWTTTLNGEDCTASGCMRAGNDLVMPGSPVDHENLKKELEAGTLTVEDIRACVTRLIRVVLRSGLYE